MIKFLFGKFIAKEVAKEMDSYRSLMVEKVNDCCVDIIRYMFSEEAPKEDCCWSLLGRGFYRKTIKGELENGVVESVVKEMSGRERARVQDMVQGEEFIDGIVERIRKKQINS